MSSLPEILMTGNGTSDPVLVGLGQNPQWQAAPQYAVGFIATVSSGATLTYTLQVTGDRRPSSSGYWNDHDVLVGLTSSMSSNVGYPITGYRLVVSGWTSGNVHLGVAIWP